MLPAARQDNWLEVSVAFEDAEELETTFDCLGTS